MPEGTVAFAGEPLLCVTAPRIEAQLLETVMRDGRSELRDPLRVLRARAATELRAVPATGHYPVVLSDRLARLTADVQGIAPADLHRPLEQHGRT